MVLRSILAFTVGVVATLIMFIFVLFVSLFERKGKGVHLIGRLWARIILFLCGIKVEIKGAKNLLRDRPQILISNHQGAFDIPVFQAYLPLQFRWVSKKEAFRYPIIGWAMSLAGYVSVDRQYLKEAYKSLKESEKKLKEGFSILMFPEGTRSKEETVMPFKRGAFLLSIRTGLPITPIAIRGTGRVTKRGFPWISPASVKIYIDKPLEPVGLKEGDARDFMEKAYDIIKRNFEGLDWSIGNGN